MTTAGRSLTTIRRIVVYRYTEEPPAEGAPPTLAPTQFAKLATRLDSIEGANLPDAATGTKLTYEDAPSFRSESGRPLRHTYAVVTEGLAAKSELSNLISIQPLDAAVPPATLKALATPEGVILEWPAPKKSISGGDAPVIVGYNVYRDDVVINTSPVTETRYTDAPPYGEHQYRVTAVASVGPPRIESLPSPLATAHFRDLVPPPAPVNVSALIETRIIRLLWDAVDAPDLAGYNVYRYEGTARLKMTPIGPLKSPFFGDEGPDPGITYVYAVTSIDNNGNESAETKSMPVLVPKTP